MGYMACPSRGGTESQDGTGGVGNVGEWTWKESRRGKYRFWHWQYEHAQRTSKSVQDDLKLLISSTRAIPRLSPSLRCPIDCRYARLFSILSAPCQLEFPVLQPSSKCRRRCTLRPSYVLTVPSLSRPVQSRQRLIALSFLEQIRGPLERFCVQHLSRVADHTNRLLTPRVFYSTFNIVPQNLCSSRAPASSSAACFPSHPDPLALVACRQAASLAGTMSLVILCTCLNQALHLLPLPSSKCRCHHLHIHTLISAKVER